MPALRDYEDKYPSIRFERRNGVLQMTLHHDGGEFIVTRRRSGLKSSPPDWKANM